MALVTGITLPNNGDRIKAENYNDPINKILAQVNGSLNESNIASLNGSAVNTGTLPYNALNTAAQRTIGGGWNDLGYTFSSVTYNGNRSYTAVVSGQDTTSYTDPGTRIRTTRTVAAPTQSTSLNGTTQYYSKSSPAGMTFTDDFTVSAWIKLSSYGAQTTIESRVNGTSGWVFGTNSNGQIELFGFNGSLANYSGVTSYQSLPLNKWIHVAAQLDMSAFTATTTTSYIMVDGADVPAVVGRGGTNPIALVQAGNLEVGSRNAGSFFPGKIANVAVFNAKVTQATMRGYMSQSLAGNEASLISAYSFSNTINDLNTTNANNLTANGGAVATNADSPFGGQSNGSISSTLDYGIITSTAFSTNTTYTIQVPEGCTIPTSGGISAVSYSSGGSPYGFPTAFDLSGMLYAMPQLRSVWSGGSVGGSVINGLQATINVPTNQKLKITLNLPQFYNSVDAIRGDFYIMINGTPVATWYERSWTSAGGGNAHTLVTEVTVLAGSMTIDARIGFSSGIGTVFASATNPAYLKVERSQ